MFQFPFFKGGQGDFATCPTLVIAAVPRRAGGKTEIRFV
jgi:hypothetical protein